MLHCYQCDLFHFVILIATSHQEPIEHAETAVKNVNSPEEIGKIMS